MKIENENGYVLLVLIAIFVVALIVMTLFGALFLWVCVEIFGVGKFSWWYAFVIGFLLAFLTGGWCGKSSD